MLPGFSYFPAPAKLNLFLHINGRRADGYHLLQTLFQLLDFGDEIGFRLRDDGVIRRVSASPVPEHEDLVFRAARALAEKAPDQVPGVDIDLIKRLPMGGGVGGGSSDAATVLLVLNHLWGLRLSGEELAGVGVGLGADVPVFVRGCTAWAEGVGEKLLPVEMPAAWYLVVHPGCHVSTAEIFSDSDLTRDTPLTTIADFLAGRGRNDCEPVVVRRYPQVAAALEWLGQFADSRLTGTGACVFASFHSESAAKSVLADLPDQYSGFVAQGVNRSPLLSRLSAWQD